MEKELENSEKKKRIKQLSQPVRPCSLARALPPSLAAQWGQPVAESLPRMPLSSLSPPWACPVSSAPSRLPWTGACALAHVARFLGHDARPAPFLEPRQCPAHTPCLISLSFTLSRALPTPPAAAGDPRPRSQPSSSPETAPSLLELRPEVRHSSLCPISLYCTLCSANFTFAGARPRRTTVLARWPTDLARSSSPE
jgi:hypothetical protein